MTKERLRHCIAHDKKAFFHRWADVVELVEPSPMIGEHTGGVVRDVFAIVEFEDGDVAQVRPENIRFLDTPKMEE